MPSRAEIPAGDRLNDTNYETWCIQMQSVFQLKRLWQFVISDPSTNDKNREEKADALATLRLSVTPAQLRHLKNVNSAKEGWDALSTAHKRTGPAYELQLYRQLGRKCSDANEVEAHVEDFCGTADKMASLGSTISDKVLVYMLLDSLPKELEYFEVAMTTREDLPALATLKLKIKEEITRQKTCPEGVVEEREQAWLARNRKFNPKKSNNRTCYRVVV